MNTHRKTAKIVGWLFIIGTVAGSLSVILTSSILGAPDYLTEIAANETLVVVGAIAALVTECTITVKR